MHPCDTPNESDYLQDLTSNKIYHLLGNRCFCNYKHFRCTSKDAKFVQGGKHCPYIGEFYNLRKRARGKYLAPTNHYLDKVHLDIVFEDTTSKLGYRYAILLIDHATKYIWLYGVKSLLSKCIIEALEKFAPMPALSPSNSAATATRNSWGVMPTTGSIVQSPRSLVPPPGASPPNRLAKCARAIVCAMAQAYMTEK